MKNRCRNIASRISAMGTALALWAASSVHSLAAGGLDIAIGTDGITIKPPGTNVSIGGTDYLSGMANFITKYKNVAIIVLAICIITTLLCLIFSITRLGAASVNADPRMKHTAMMGILICCIALALFGGLGVVVGFFWNLLLPGGI